MKLGLERDKARPIRQVQYSDLAGCVATSKRRICWHSRSNKVKSSPCDHAPGTAFAAEDARRQRTTPPKCGMGMPRPTARKQRVADRSRIEECAYLIVA